MKTACIIPSRYASTRLPGKPLKMIVGKTLIRRVYEQTSKAKSIDDVIIATDSKLIEKEVKGFGGKVVITSKKHNTGTDRIAEVAKNTDYDIIVNVQGDEPLIEPELIDNLVREISTNDNLDMVTAAAPLRESEYEDPSCVKVVRNIYGEALYFSRSLIPYPRHEFSVPPLRHIGIYAYRKEFLLKYANMKQTSLEKTESLEQLRLLENGYKIGIVTAKSYGIGVDTQEDLEKVIEYIKRREL